MIEMVFGWLYNLALLGLAVYGLQSLVLALLYLLHGRRRPPEPAPPPAWPTVTVQLPIYNEQYVVERLIAAACALDYPAEALSIQVLDDSTDDTLALSRRLVEHYQARGVNIALFHREDRSGYKAGALANGLQHAAGAIIAIFDADFVPPPEFLRRMVPYLASDPGLGMVQARWGHLNNDYNLLTRGQALFLDGHFVIEQATRSRAGLLFNFNGSAGLWRQACILDAGGWQGDTLSEDLDLSYRAQMQGWRFAFIPEVVAPAEIPPQVAALKQQQYRWARGSIQVLRKLWQRMWGRELTARQRIGGLIHLSAYSAHLLMMLVLVTSLPLALLGVTQPAPLKWLSLVGFGPPFLFALSQWAVYPHWKRRLLFFPVLLAIGVGLAFNNSRAVLAAFTRKPAAFVRTPKFRLQEQGDAWQRKSYVLPVDWTVWVELGMFAYAMLALAIAWNERLSAMTPMLALFALGFGYVGLLGLGQARR